MKSSQEVLVKSRAARIVCLLGWSVFYASLTGLVCKIPRWEIILFASMGLLLVSGIMVMVQTNRHQGPKAR